MATGRPDWFGTIVAAGKYDTTFIPIGLDESGAILALMKGAYDSVFKTIKVDSDGRMDARLHTMRYGKAREIDGRIKVPGNSVTTLFTLESEGVIYCGEISLEDKPDNYGDKLILYIDDDEHMTMELNTTFYLGNIVGSGLSMSMLKYDDTYGSFLVLVRGGITFDSKVHLTWTNYTASEISVKYSLRYAETT